MAKAAALLDKSIDWDNQALELIEVGIEDRLQTLVRDGRTAEEWLAKQKDSTGCGDMNSQHRQFRAGVARDVRDAELAVLSTLTKTANEW